MLAALARRNRYPARLGYLIIGAVAVTMIIAEQLIVSNGLWREFPHILQSTSWMPFLIGPAIWLFVKSLGERRPLSRDAIHFAPAAIAFIYFTPYFLQSGAAKIALFEQTTTIPLDATIFGVAKAASMIGYMLLARIELSRSLDRNESRLTRHLAHVLTLFLLYVGVVLAAFAAEHVVGDLPVSSDTLAAVGSAVFFYAVSLVVVAEWRETANRPVPIPIAPAPPPPSERADLLDPATSASLYREVLAAVQARSLYQRADVKIDQMADLVGLPVHYLSYVINGEAGRNYQSWLNGLRVEHAKQALLATPQKSVIEVGLEAGFNSKASFNRAFKAETGASPSEYRASQIAN